MPQATSRPAGACLPLPQVREMRSRNQPMKTKSMSVKRTSCEGGWAREQPKEQPGEQTERGKAGENEGTRAGRTTDEGRRGGGRTP